MFNPSRLEEVLVNYKQDFTTWWKDEKYKWEAIKVFQDNWDIDAKDFAAMLRKSLSKTKNLLASNNNFPRRVIVELAKANPENVRNMFRDLYDESYDVVERIIEFKKQAKAINEEYSDNGKKDFQSENAISTYLWLRYPDKYYIYKISVLTKVANTLESNYAFHSGAYVDNLRNFYKLYDEISAYVNANTELKKLLEDNLTDSCYRDPEYKTLTTDICYYLKQQASKKAKSSTEQEEDTDILTDNSPLIWKISHGTDSTGIPKELREKFAERKVAVVHGKTKALATSATSQGEMFLNQIKKGDYFYLCYGNSIQLLGQFTSDDASLCKDIKDEWYEREYHVIAESKDSSPYNGEKKWWTPNQNSTCVPINNEQDLFEKLILKPYFDMTINDMLSMKVEDSDHGYWWLVANPSYWNFSQIAIGEQQFYTLRNEKGNRRRIYQNFLDAKPGDLVIGYEATPVKKVVALCKIVAAQDGEKISFEKTENLVSPVDYTILKQQPELEDMEFFNNLTGSLFRLTKEEYDFIVDLASPDNLKQDTFESYSKDDFLSEVFMTEEQYDKFTSVLGIKKNVILQGAPGVGKTFAAKRLAYSIMGEKNSSRIEFIQFHQNYSYEDFMMGYRPTESGFELRTGVFYNFCKKASNQPDSKFFFIIDEINRGNMSKIFGELLMMIENDYRGTNTTLAYDGSSFSVPKNLYIIGMMNTADRSLAMIDYALRRRFSFIEIQPGFDSEGFKKYQKKLSNETFDRLIAKVKELNEAITLDNSLGKGFCIGHSYFSNWKECTKEKMLAVVEYDIIPMLEEYWFDDTSKVQRWKDELLGVLK